MYAEYKAMWQEHIICSKWPIRNSCEHYIGSSFKSERSGNITSRSVWRADLGVSVAEDRRSQIFARARGDRGDAGARARSGGEMTLRHVCRATLILRRPPGHKVFFEMIWALFQYYKLTIKFGMARRCLHQIVGIRVWRPNNFLGSWFKYIGDLRARVVHR